ncbi:MAG: type II secretion system minor pseudopilin GspK [Rhodocyclaceae bacterium]|nr:type II secretion system minor pseudopilin GspK [Rhodocyclaceae bacterium]
MPARSPASWRCAERGAAVITALLTVALVAGLASALLADYGASLESLAGRHDQAQARWLARGAIDWGRNVLSDDAARTTVDHLGEPWAIRVPPTPVEDGEVSGELRDQSGLFNLNNLAPGGAASEEQQEAFVRLCGAVGIPGSEATRVALTITDWIDADGVSRFTGGDEASVFAAEGASQRPPDAELAHVDELAAIPGVGADLIERLRPFVTALPAPSQVNANTASAEVLHAIVPDLPLDTARVLVAERERAWFKDIPDFNARLPEGSGPAIAAHTGVRSLFILATGRARYGLSVVRMEVLLDRRQKWPRIVWQRIL